MSGMGTVCRQFLGLAVSSACIFSGNCAIAQITPDRTLPNNSNVTINGSTFNITGGTQAGRNLFHSFQTFSVPTGGTASFNNGLDIQNIFSRVTGGSASNIDGIIKANGTANLFFLNPNGIVFGKNARLNVGGSFLATTANAIQFGNLGTFSATVPDNPALLTVNPTALFYNQINAAASLQNHSIAPAGVAPSGGNSSGLRVPDGKSLLLVGGEVTMDGGRLRAYGGHVELGGLAALGTVGLEVNGNNLSLSFPNLSPRSDVSLTNQASVSVNGTDGGSIAVNARNIDISGGSFLNAGITQGLGFIGAKAGDITLNATGNIKINGDGSGVFSNIQQQAVGNGGNITLSSNSILLNDGAQLSVSTFGQGDGGNLIINATNDVSFNGSDVFSNVGSFNNILKNVIKGNGGNIQINTSQLSITNDAQLQTITYGQGNAGNVIINATNKVSLDGSNTRVFSSVGADNSNQNNLAIGKGSNIQINTSQLSLSNGAELVATTYGQGNAGNVMINATQGVTLSNALILSPVQSKAIGNGGNIEINTSQLSLSNGAALVASTLGQGNAGNVIINATKGVTLDRAVVFSTVESEAIGNGGNIQINTPELFLNNSAQLIASTYGQGNAGNIIIDATKSITLSGRYTTSNGSILSSGIFTSVGDADNNQNNIIKGNAGNIQITTSQLSLKDGSQLRANTFGQGNAGNVIINATKSVTFDGRYAYRDGNFVASGIINSVGSLNNVENNIIKGNGGNIQITTEQLSLTNGAQLSASTFGQGNAGNVIINATNKVSLDGRNTEHQHYY